MLPGSLGCHAMTPSWRSEWLHCAGIAFSWRALHEIEIDLGL